MKTDELLKQAKQNEGESSISRAEKSFDSKLKAEQVFLRLKTKVLNIREWNDHAMLSSYEIFDENGEIPQNEKLFVGAFIRISLTGSGKYDWVRVIDIFETADEFIITVKPTFDPTAEDIDKKVISHFFTDESTNNFCLWQKDETAAFYVIGLNEKQNTGETKNALETVRNVAVNVGSYLGIQEGEWEKFCHHFLEDTAKEKE